MVEILETRGVAVVFDDEGKAELIVSTAAGKGKPKQGAKKLGPGMFVKRKGGGGDRVWGYRGGKLRFTAVARPDVAKRAGVFKAALREAGIG